jgi:hypothetical protein
MQKNRFTRKCLWRIAKTHVDRQTCFSGGYRCHGIVFVLCILYSILAYLGKLDSQCKKKRFTTLQQHKKVIELLCFLQ